MILSDVNGLYSADPHKDKNATLIKEVKTLDEQTLALAGGAGSSLGTGGMKTKLSAAKICTDGGCDMIIANGENPEILYEIVEGKNSGYTRFFA